MATRIIIGYTQLFHLSRFVPGEGSVRGGSSARAARHTHLNNTQILLNECSFSQRRLMLSPLLPILPRQKPAVFGLLPANVLVIAGSDWGCAQDVSRLSGQQFLLMSLHIFQGFLRHLPFAVVAQFLRRLIKRHPVGAPHLMPHLVFDLADSS